MSTEPRASGGISEESERLLFRVVAVVSVAFGAVALVLPSLLSALYEVDDTVAVAATLRFFGAYAIAFGVGFWRLAAIREARRGLVTAMLVLQVLLIVCAIVAMATGAAGPFMWQVVALSGILGVLGLWAARSA